LDGETLFVVLYQCAARDVKGQQRWSGLLYDRHNRLARQIDTSRELCCRVDDRVSGQHVSVDLFSDVRNELVRLYSVSGNRDAYITEMMDLESRLLNRSM
jgi:hypothetical protein